MQWKMLKASTERSIMFQYMHIHIREIPQYFATSKDPHLGKLRECSRYSKVLMYQVGTVRTSTN